jgi:trimeric autotransporter adhesin
LQNTTSSSNTAVGFQSLINNTTGSSNAAFGSGAGLLFNSGNFNTFLGTNAGSSLTSGYDNVLIGFSGQGPGFLNSGNNNIIIGSIASPSTPNVSNEITLGNSSNTVLRCAVTSITSLSDARDKKEIEELPVGLEFVEKLKPVKFTWEDRNEEGKHDVEDFGFIAQDLKASQEEVNASYLGLVYEANPEKLEASYGKLLPVLVKAIQELSSEVKSLKEELETLKNK